MLDLNAPVWKAISGAYGPIQPLLQKLVQGEGDFEENLEILAEDLGHQLSFYTGTCYALPHLAALCARQPSLSRKIQIILAIGAAVAAEGDPPLPPDNEQWREFHEGLNAFAPQITDLIQNHMDVLQTLSMEQKSEFALSALALLGNRRHAWALYLYGGWDELPAMCSNPACGWEEECMDFSLEEDPEYVSPIALESWDGVSLTREEVWFPGLLQQMGEDLLLPRLPYLYGFCTCPECGAKGPMWEWLLRFCDE